jgi:hypothetical protein
MGHLRDKEPRRPGCALDCHRESILQGIHSSGIKRCVTRLIGLRRFQGTVTLQIRSFETSEATCPATQWHAQKSEYSFKPP